MGRRFSPREASGARVLQQKCLHFSRPECPAKVLACNRNLAALRHKFGPMHYTRVPAAVKISSAAADPHADSLGFEMDPRPLEALARAVLGAAAGADGAAGRHPVGN